MGAEYWYMNKILKKKTWESMLLLIILGVAAFFRLYHLGDLPQGFHNDEVMNGYVGRYTLQNGVDLYGNKWPFLYFDNFGDYPNILPMYVSGLSTYFFGVNEFAVRFPIAMAGIISVGLAYLITLQLTGSRTSSLLAALGLAVLPWHIVLSRATAEAVLASSVYLAGLWLLMRSVKIQKITPLFSAAGLFGLTYLLYPSFRIFIPLSLVPLVFLYRKRWSRLSALMITGVFILCTFLISQTTWGKGRYEQTSIFTFNGVFTGKIQQLIFDDKDTPYLITRIFHNKLWAGGREILSEYVNYWSGNFLFIEGGLPARYRITEQGLFYFTIMSISFLALLLIFTKKNTESRSFKLPVLINYFGYLLVISPLPAALTAEDTPNVHRALLMGVLLVMVLGMIAGWLAKQPFWNKKCIISLLVLFFVFEMAYFWHHYSVHDMTSQAQYRNNETTLLAQYLILEASAYDGVIAPTDSRLALRYLFYSGRFDKELAGKFGHKIHIEAIDTIRFSFGGCSSLMEELSPEKREFMVIDTDSCPLKEDATLIHEVLRDDGSLAYRIYKVARP
jgi:4-amino-4-deoxy-L-arabinose transferase-like glycosyltransferase